MKPIYLEFCGINSFSEKAQIDFEALLSGGVFGIFGDTGSGKSTILDSIHFALYGEIDRVPKSFNDCINYRSESASVSFDFEITFEGERKRYRVKRERKRKNGATKAYLYQHTTDGGLFALAEGTREVDTAVEKILGLSFADFKTCIALPQGDFAALVKSTTSERVKLVSRLFNLEKYGEKLSKAVNERYYQAEEEVNLIKAKMGENEGGSEELFAQTQERIAEKRAELTELRKATESAEKAYALAQEADKAKRDYDALCKRLTELDERLPKMETLQKRLSLLPKAQAVKEKADALQASREAERIAEERLKSSQAEYESAQAERERAITAQEKENYDEKILRLSVDLQRVEDAQADVEAEKIAKNALQECIAKYNALKNECQEEDFSGKRQALEAEIDALGEDGTLLDYLKRNYKGVLLTDVHGEIRADLQSLAQKYPQAQADIDVLIQKYATIQSAEETTFDITTIHLAFKEIERKRKRLRDTLAELEKRRLAYEENEHKKKMLAETGANLRESYNVAKQKIQAIQGLGSVEELSARMQSLKTARQTAKEQCEKAQSRVSACFAETEKRSGLLSLQKQTTQACETALEKSLKETGFSQPSEAQRLLDEIGNAERAQAECKAFFESYALASSERAKTDISKFQGFDEQALERALQEKEEEKQRFEECNKTLGAYEKELERLEKLKEKYKEQQKQLAEKEKHKNVCDELRMLVRSNKFLEFIASEYLQEICSSASKTLLSLTGGRYFLRYDKEFKVGDNLDGGNLRAVKTLSGGETFLVSLSLALSLSGAICLKSLRPIEFFFLDEGFGTLDEKLVDTVMDVLGKLSKTFSVGLISHVEELKHRIDHKILVNGATESHGSTVKLECF